MSRVRSIVTVLVLSLLPTSMILAQSDGGYWSYLKMEVPNDRQEVAKFEGTAGNLKITSTVTLNRDTGETQTISGLFNWDAPPRVLRPGKVLKLPLKVSVIANTHPNGSASFMGGGGRVFFGTVAGPAGSNAFKDKSGNYMVGFASYGDPIGDMIKIQRGQVTLQGEFEIPPGNTQNLDDPQNTRPIIVSLNFGNDVREFAYVYGWNAGAPPTVEDIAGVWRHGEKGETWTFTPNGDGSYTATEKGFDNAVGTATFTDNQIRIDYTTNKGTSGQYVVTVSEDGRSGKGVWKDGASQSGTRDFVLITDSASKGEVGSQPTAEFAVRAGTRTVNAGDTIRIPIDLINPSDVGNLNVTVQYSSSVAQVTTKPTAGSVKGNRLFESNHTEAGIVRLGMAGTEGVKTDGQLAWIPFQAIGKPGDRTELKVTVTSVNDSSGSVMKAKTIDGAIEIVEKGGGGSGDTNQDGSVDAGDALDALKMSVKLLEENLAADMDSDGTVTSNDARLILRKAVGK